MKALPEKPTLAELQQHIKEFCIERGWDKNSDTEKFLLFTEEVGELAKAIRKHRKMYDETEKTPEKMFELEEEFADVLNYLMDLANHFNVDLESAYRKKHEVNSTRVWK